MRACRFSSVRSRSRPAKALGERRLVGAHRFGSIGSSWTSHAERRREVSRVLLGRGGGVRGGHDRDAHPLGTERVGGQARHERRVDPAGEAEHDVLEAVLLDVVVQPERRAPRRPPPRPARAARRSLRRSGNGGAPARRRRRRERRQQQLAVFADAARGGAVARVAQARRRGGVEVDVADEQLLAELGGAGDRRAGVVDHARVPVEDELVLAADESAEGDAGEVVARALGEHPLALGALAGVVGRGGDVERSASRRRAPPRSPGGPAPRCPRRRSGRCAGRSERRPPRPRGRPGSSAARRRRRSWAGRPCGRSRAPARRRGRAAAL